METILIILFVMLFGYAAAFLIVIIARLSSFVWNTVAITRDNDTLQGEASTVSPSLIITLIHGTWGRSSAWTRPGSMMRNALEDNFRGCQFERFLWSGSNSFTARSRASMGLQAHIKRVSEGFPDASHILVAHSHGGNVALMSLDDSHLSLIDGLVCLATPVLIKVKKVYDPLTSLLLRWAPLLPLLISVLILQKNKNVVELAVPGIVWLLIYAASIPACMFVVRLCRNAPDAMASFDHRSEHISNRTIFLRAAGDEASMVIGASNLLTFLLERGILLPVGGIVALGLAVRKHFGLQVSAANPYALRGLVSYASSFWSFMFFAMPIYLLLAWAALGLYIIILPLLVLPMVFLGTISLGHEMALGVLTSRVSAEGCPAGRWNAAYVALSDDGRLNHSRIYDSREALSVMTEWIRERLECEGLAK